MNKDQWKYIDDNESYLMTKVRLDQNLATKLAGRLNARVGYRRGLRYKVITGWCIVGTLSAQIVAKKWAATDFVKNLQMCESTFDSWRFYQRFNVMAFAYSAYKIK